MVSEDEARRLQGLLRTLNPRAHIVPTVHSRVPLSAVVNTGRFSMEEAARSAGWLQVGAAWRLHGAHPMSRLERRCAAHCTGSTCPPAGLP